MSERDEGLSARDAEMLDSLYRTAQEPIAGDAELEQLQQLRSVFAELKAHQDEPPPAGMALLMAAARQAAEERRPVGLWAKLRAGWSSMLAHPAMSAVAAAVVVVGVGGYLVARGVRPAAEQAPTVSSAAEPAAPTAAPSTIATGEVAESAAAASQATPTAEPMTEEAARLEPERELKAAAGRKEVQERAQPKPAQVTTKGARAPELAAKKRADAPRDEAEQEEISAPKLQEQWTAVPEEQPAPVETAPVNAKPVPAPTKAAPPSPGTRDKPVIDATSEKGAGGRAGGAPSAGLAQADGDDSRGEDAPSRSQRWYELAKAAATRGDCEAVSLFGARIKSEDPAFYEARFRKDAAIAKCLPRGSEKR